LNYVLTVFYAAAKMAALRFSAPVPLPMPVPDLYFGHRHGQGQGYGHGKRKQEQTAQSLPVIADIRKQWNKTGLKGWIFSWQRAHNKRMVDNTGERTGQPSAIPNGRERSRCADYSCLPSYC
jgi:hypothetical protein